MSVRDEILNLAEQHNIVIGPVPLENLAAAITRLADDEPFLDNTDRALILLAQAGHIDGQTFISLCHAWQIEKRTYQVA